MGNACFDYTGISFYTLSVYEQVLFVGKQTSGSHYGGN